MYFVVVLVQYSAYLFGPWILIGSDTPVVPSGRIGGTRLSPKWLYEGLKFLLIKTSYLITTGLIWKDGIRVFQIAALSLFVICC